MRLKSNSRLLRDLTFGSAALLTVALVAATLAERVAGSGVAFAAIYHSPWMIALWAVTAGCGAAYVVVRRRGLSLPAVCLHIALLVILAGAAVTFLSGKQGKLTLSEGESPASGFTLDEGGWEPLPFSIALDHTEIEYYPCTPTPMDYASVVTVSDADGKTASHRLSMNNILDIQGYRFYQTSMGDGSSTLSVSYDPWGIGVTYGGYLLLFVSMAAFFFSRRSRFRQLSRKVAAVASLLLVPVCASAGPTPVPQTIPRPLAARLGKVNVCWGGRVMPLQTMARDFCLKVNGSDSYRGLTPEQVVAGWLFYYDSWKNEPFIKVEGEEAARLLSIGSSRFASIKDFYSNRGYKLEHAVAADLADRKLRDTDSRVALVTMACTGAAFDIFPIRGDGDDAPVRWLSFADRPPSDIPEEDYIFITTILDRLSREIAGRQWKNADDEITRLREFQSRMAPVGSLPSGCRLEAELLYNRVGSPLWSGVILLMAGIAGFIFRGKRRWVFIGVASGLSLWMSGILGLRWYVGGHIPLSNGYETMLLMGWLSVVLALLFLTRKGGGVAGYAALIVGGLSLMVAMMGRGASTVSHLMPVLSSPLLSIHVLLVMGAYSLMAIIAILSAVNLFRPERATSQPELLLYPAVFLLAAGIFVGAVWANQSWGRYWGWDPKETWALVTLLVYAFPLHAGSFPMFRKKRTLDIYLMLAFLSVLMTYFGVNYLLSGLHSYA